MPMEMQDVGRLLNEAGHAENYERMQRIIAERERNTLRTQLNQVVAQLKAMGAEPNPPLDGESTEGD